MYTSDYNINVRSVFAVIEYLIHDNHTADHNNFSILYKCNNPANTYIACKCNSPANTYTAYKCNNPIETHIVESLLI